MLNKLSLILALLIISVYLHSQNIEDKWNFNKDIIPVGEVKEYSYLFLDREVYSKLGNNLDSIRIADGSDSFVPYYFDNYYKTEDKTTRILASKRINSEEIELTTIEYEQINYTRDEYSIEEKVYKSVFDFQVIPDQEGIKGDILGLEIDGKSYSKQVQVYGRDAKSDWINIGSDTIYNFDGYSKTDISFNNLQYYSFYRLVVLNNKENLDIKSLSLIYNKKEIDTRSFRKSLYLDFEIENHEKKSIITLKNADKLKISSLSIKAEGRYKRSFKVKKVVDGEELYTSVNGKIYNFQFNDVDISSNSIDLNSRIFEDCDEIKIIVDNKDNPPLKIETIKADYLVDKIIFKSDKETKYKLFFGNSDASRPAYDIEDFKEYIKKEDVSEASLSGIRILREDQVEKELPLQTIFNILIVLIAIALFIVIIFKMKPVKRK